ncbi:MAG: Rpp14/Pop5 family protein [Desulfurococcaceae archaeon]
MEYILLALLIASVIVFSSSILLLQKSLRYFRAVKTLMENRVKGVKKPRKRYVVFAVICEDRVLFKSVENAVKEKFVEYYGESMYHKASPRLILYDETTGRGVIRVLHTCTDYLLATMGLIKKINDKNCIMLPIKTTGTLRKAREYVEKLKL